MNIECGREALTELEHAFKFNDAVLRHLVVAMTEAVVAPSPMMKDEKSRSLTGKDGKEGKDGKDGERQERAPAKPAADAAPQGAPAQA